MLVAPADVRLLTSALEVRTAAFWASWADSMKMVKERHPTIANELMVKRAQKTISEDLPAVVSRCRLYRPSVARVC